MAIEVRGDLNKTVSPLNSFLTINEKCRLWGKLFSKNVVNVDVTLNFKNR